MADIEALPFPFPFKPDKTALIVIDMQRDFAEPGGFGASLGNDVSRVTAIVPTVRRLIEGFRAAGLPVIHTMECHRPDLSDLPPAKRDRGNPTIRIGDAGPMGRVLIADADRGIASITLGRRQVRQVRPVALHRVDDRQAGIAKSLDQAFYIRHDSGDAADVVAEACAEAPGFGEIALHVDDDQRQLIRSGRESERFCRYVTHQ